MFGNVMRDFLYCLIFLLKRRSKNHKITVTVMISYPEFVMSSRTLFIESTNFCYESAEGNCSGYHDISVA